MREMCCQQIRLAVGEWRISRAEECVIDSAPLHRSPLAAVQPPAPRECESVDPVPVLEIERTYADAELVPDARGQIEPDVVVDVVPSAVELSGGFALAKTDVDVARIERRIEQAVPDR